MLIVRKSEGRRALGRPGRRWENIITVDKSIGKARINLAQGRDRW
jgi:hypothetical protein